MATVFGDLQNPEGSTLPYVYSPDTFAKTFLVLACYCHYILGMRTEHIQIRVSSEEKRIFKEAADSVGLPLSEWIRRWLTWSANMVVTERGERHENPDLSGSEDAKDGGDNA